MPFTQGPEVAPVEMLPGVFRKTMTTAPSMMLCEITLRAGAAVPLHQHPHDQIGYVVRGRIRMVIGGQERTCGPGDAYAIPGGTPHLGEALEDCTVIDVFHPQREEYR